MHARLGSKLVTSIPVTDTSIYASGDQIGTAPLEVKAFDPSLNAHGIIESLTVVDFDKQGSAMDVLFFSKLPVFAGSQNAAFSMTDAQAQASYIGMISVLAADFVDIGNQKVASYKAVGLLVRAETTPLPPQTYRSLWLGIICRGTPTYTTAASLILRLGLYNH